MLGLLIKGMLIGILFGIPAGAVGIMTMHRTINYGVKTGLLTGLGSSAADCLYTCMAAFGLTFLSDILIKYQKGITIAGSILILYMGVALLKRKEKQETREESLSLAGMFLTSFIVGITNPAAILTFVFAFSFMGIGKQEGGLPGIGLVCGVFIGTYFWWGMLTGLSCFLKRKAKKLEVQKINRIFGGILAALGTVIFIKAIV